MRLRLFLTCWVIFCLHYATDFVREHFLVVSMVEKGTFDLGDYYRLHEDIFVNPPNAKVQGVHHGANPGISMLAAIPYALTRPLVDRVVARQLAVRKARGDTSAVYNDPRQARVRFYREAVTRGLDVRFGLVGIITMVLCMAPLSALGVVVMFMILRGAGLAEKTSAWLSLLYAFGTPVLFRTAYLNQNLAVGIAGLVALLFLWNPSQIVRWSPRTRLFVAGLAGGFAFLCDYSGALATGLLGLYAMLRARDSDAGFGGPWRAALGYGLGAFGMVLVLWFYQWASFGNFILPPQNWMPAVIHSEQGYQGVTGPSWDLFKMLLLHPAFGLICRRTASDPRVRCSYRVAARQELHARPRAAALWRHRALLHRLLLGGAVHAPAVEHGDPLLDARRAVSLSPGCRHARAASQVALMADRRRRVDRRLVDRDGAESVRHSGEHRARVRGRTAAAVAIDAGTDGEAVRSVARRPPVRAPRHASRCHRRRRYLADQTAPRTDGRRCFRSHAPHIMMQRSQSAANCAIPLG